MFGHGVKKERLGVKFTVYVVIGVDRISDITGLFSFVYFVASHRLANALSRHANSRKQIYTRLALTFLFDG